LFIFSIARVHFVSIRLLIPFSFLLDCKPWCNEEKINFSVNSSPSLLLLLFCQRSSRFNIYFQQIFLCPQTFFFTIVVNLININSMPTLTTYVRTRIDVCIFIYVYVCVCVYVYSRGKYRSSTKRKRNDLDCT